jgi:LysM repeat protein
MKLVKERRILMHRKVVSLVLMVLLAFALSLTGCQRSATPKLDEVPSEDESAEMVKDAEQNTEKTQETQAVTPETKEEAPAVADTATPVTKEEAPAVADTATPAPTETPTSEPTEVPKPEATEAPPSSEPGTTPEPIVVQNPGTHVVQPGENLFRIALKYGKTVDEVAKANGITNASVIRVGQTLVIPGGSGQAPPPPTGGDGKTYVVQPGDNLFRIALKYNYDQYYLARYNGIDNPAMIYVGQVIRIP